ncbi:uncharacterized protein LOC129981337 [Argiope bruennichi]|uniref:Cuticle protein 10.9 like protein n=1 Tax=Argiope bruennichi TaxID=94029 RepID=A0A8T0FWV5_ARGBR|nr:uncharacterized protein LOC129981337 [Argiope bruennichi]KAF8795561.1 Cuticle protein 10.9 like protein [Argiope bruennichi]
MQLTVVLVLCFVSILKCSSQGVTESETQYSTEGSSAGTQAIDWDTADSPARTTLQNGGRRRHEQNTRTTSDYTTLFPNQWGPVMMPMMQPPFGTRIPNADTRERMQDTRDFDPNPRRQKESPENLTQKVDQYPKPTDTSRNQMTAPFIPYSPYMFYPAQNPAEVSEDTRFSIPSNSANDAQPLTLQDLSEKMNISASSPDQFFYRLPNAGFHERFGRMPFPLMRYPPPGFSLRNTPDGRNQESFVPFSPYALPPYGLYPPSPPPAAIPTDEGNPQVDIFVRSPYIDREPGTENLGPKEVPIRSDANADLNSPDVPPSTPTPVDTVPAESIPRPPLPINPFPFGFFPPGIVPPSLFPLPQGEIPPPTLPPRLIPSPPVPSIEPLPPRVPPVVPPSVPPATPVDRMPEIVPAPPAAIDLPPPAVELPPPEGPANLPAPVSESSTVPESVPPQGDVFTGDKELYEFGFDMNDGKGTDQHRQESKDEAGVVTGSYGYRDAFGVYRLVNYIADKNGYRAFIQSNEPGVANPGSADVVVMAERPPPQTVAESLKPTQPVPVEVPDDLIVQASENK